MRDGMGIKPHAFISLTLNEFSFYLQNYIALFKDEDPIRRAFA